MSLGASYPRPMNIGACLGLERTRKGKEGMRRKWGKQGGRRKSDGRGPKG